MEGGKKDRACDCPGQPYAVYIDGQPIAYTTHNELLDGAHALIGIYSSPGYSEVDFDNVKFWDLNNLLTPVGAAASETTRPVCTSGQTELLYEDFEDQQVESAGWRFRDELLNATTAWPIIADDNGNYVWLGSNDARAAWMDFPAYDYVVRLRMRMRDLDSELFVIFRIDSRPNGLYGYYFSTESGFLTPPE